MGAIKRLIPFTTILALFIILTLGTGSDLAVVSEAAVYGFQEDPAINLIPPSAYKTAPGDLPTFFVEQRPGEKGDGYLFVSMFKRQSDRRSYHLILDDDGQLVYYQALDSIRSSNDFKKQPGGFLTYFSPEEGDVSYVVLNKYYQKVREIRAVADPQSGKAYTIDNHGLQLFEDGHALFMIYDRRVMDLSGLVPGGNPEALVTGCVIQEVDGENNLVFQWRSWDHIPITDTQLPLDRKRLSYVHCNSVEADHDGNLLVSHRNLHEITKIARPGGEIIWRLGGKQNEFNFVNDMGFSIQHDARRQANGNITIYDNANAESGMNSRGVEYEVDEINKTVHLVAEYRNTPETYGEFMGNMQRLPNGNTLIGWGTTLATVFTEFEASGEKVLEFTSVEGMVSYRAFRFPWQGYPTWPPALTAVFEREKVHLYFSWNGSTETASYYIDGGQDSEKLQTLALVSKNGFETAYTYEMTRDGLWFFRVRPVSKDGAVGPPSNLVTVLAGGEPTYLPLVGGGD